jgi:hypothetical protein
VDWWWRRQDKTGARRRAHRSLASGHSGARGLTSEGAKERGEHGNLSRSSPGLVWQCGDRALMEKKQWCRNSMAVVPENRGRGKMRGGGAANGSGGRLLL